MVTWWDAVKMVFSVRTCMNVFPKAALTVQGLHFKPAVSPLLRCFVTHDIKVSFSCSAWHTQQATVWLVCYSWLALQGRLESYLNSGQACDFTTTLQLLNIDLFVSNKEQLTLDSNFAHGTGTSSVHNSSVSYPAMRMGLVLCRHTFENKQNSFFHILLLWSQTHLWKWSQSVDFQVFSLEIGCFPSFSVQFLYLTVFRGMFFFCQR